MITTQQPGAWGGRRYGSFSGRGTPIVSNPITQQQPGAWGGARYGSFSGRGFPTQYSGLRTYYGGSVRELCLVAEADAPAGMGGVPKIYKGGTRYAVYLVDTTDGNASSVRIKTSVGVKSIRLKT